jgi:hypothetical protein
MTAWMLQPHSYSQAVRPNLYRLDYRRVGAYKGMGRYARGLGVAPADCLAGQSIWCGPGTDCSSVLQYAGTPACWGASLAQWQLMATPLPAPSVLPPPTADQLAAVQTGADAAALTRL